MRFLLLECSGAAEGGGVKFNINNVVKVKLTDLGRKILAADTHRYIVLKEDRAGWSEWQLWELMQVFGPHLYMGASLPFEAEITLTGHNPGPSHPLAYSRKGSK